jgi:hypothetical protein
MLESRKPVNKIVTAPKAGTG